MTDINFWEVGASGRRYCRDYVLTDVANPYQDSAYCGVRSVPANTWETKDFYCREIAADNYLLTYTLVQAE